MGKTGEALSHPCPAGYYCPIGSQPISCPAGHYCPNSSTTPLICNLGSYQSESGQNKCNSCPNGYYCDDIKGTITPLLCLPGTVCPFGSVQVIILYQLFNLI